MIRSIGGSLLLVSAIACMGALAYLCCDWLMAWISALPMR